MILSIAVSGSLSVSGRPPPRPVWFWKFMVFPFRITCSFSFEPPELVFEFADEAGGGNA